MPLDALEGADALAIVTEWAEFRHPDFEVMAQKMKGRAIFDGRNLYDPATVKAAGFSSHCIGKATAASGEYRAIRVCPCDTFTKEHTRG